MSNDLAIISQEELDALAGRAGAEQQSGSFVPQLKVNYDEEDADGKEIKKGLFLITGQEKAIYAKNVAFRPLTHHFQWTQYDDVAKKVLNRTRLVTTLMGTDEPRDELGTIKCGKPSSKDLKANPALAKKYEDITCYRQVQGLASYTGVDADGVAHTVENVECCLRLKGANFAPFEEEYFGKIGKGRVWDHVINLYTTKEKNGASTYYVIHFDDVDFTKREPVTIGVFNVAKAFQDRVDETNRAVDKKYFDVLHGKTVDDKATSALKSVGGLDSDFDDDIPF
jgi:hypothetical protein